MRRKQRGAVMVVTLAILAGLVALLAAAAITQREKFRETTVRMQQRRAEIAADAGIQRALAQIQTITAGSASTTQDEWATLGTNGDDLFEVGNAAFRLQIVDAARFVNLNSAPETQLQRMPFTQEQIDSLLDWREPGNTPRPEGGKDEYYNNLPNPYNTKLRRLDSFDELLSIKGFSAGRLYEPQTDVVSTATQVTGPSDQQPTLAELSTVDSFSPNLAPNGQAKLNVNAGGTTAAALQQRGLSAVIANQIVAGRPYTGIGRVLNLVGNDRDAQRIVLDELTTSAAPRIEGKINLNTASESVLNTVPNLPPDVVSSIVSRQEQGFTRLSDLLDIPGLSGATLTDTIDLFEVSSQTFLVRAMGVAGDTFVSREAVVEFTNGTARVLRVVDPPFADMRSRWGWATETTNEITLLEAGR